MKVEVEKLGNSCVRLRIEIAVDEVNEELERNYKALRTKVSVPGFRKGRVPSSILKARFAEHVKAEAIQNLVPPAYEQALISERLIPLGNLDISPPMHQMEIKENQPLAFEAVVDVKPDFVLPEYEELEIDKSPANVPREDVDAYIHRLQAQHATYTPLEIDRLVQEGDAVRIDWECFVDGKPITDGRREDMDVELGKGTLLPAIESGLIGMRANETREVEADFDLNHQNPELAGKHAVFNVALHAITEKHLPPLDDEFAKDLEYENYDQLYGAIWNNLVEEQKAMLYQRQREEVLQQLIEKTEIEIPGSIVDQHVQQTVQNVQQQLRRDRQTPEQAGIDMEKLPTELREDAIRQTKQSWIFDSIADRERIRVTDDELDIEIRLIAEQQNRDAQKYASLLKANNRLEEFRTTLRDDKIYRFLIQRASAKRSLIIS
ncbi:MAG: trigger factor [Candidatus Poribacteria bacterium]|nr:trigger factor [Candidatus Poribacteria bacterium]